MRCCPRVVSTIRQGEKAYGREHILFGMMAATLLRTSLTSGGLLETINDLKIISLARMTIDTLDNPMLSSGG